MLMKFKPVYAVYVNNEQVGVVQSKNEFEKILEYNLYDNKDENIAFSDINATIEYSLNLINKDFVTNEEQVLQIVQENTNKTYFQYAINIDGVNRAYVKTEEEANNIVEELQKRILNNNVSVKTVYSKELEIEEKTEIADITEDIVNEIKQEEKIKSSTINGVYIEVTPINGYISSRYGARESVRDHVHQGLDIAAVTGTPIKAVAAGTVSYSGTRGGYGNMIILDHGNGIQTYYGHCSKLYVKQGESVNAGDVIGAVGSTGNSTGPHLHFEIRQDGKYVNPQRYLYNE